MKGKWGLIASGVLCAIGSAVSAVPVGAAAQVLDHRALCGQTQTFSSTVTNQYFPLPLNRVTVLSGKEAGQTISVRITVQGEQTVAGVTTRVVEEFEWADANANRVFDDGQASLIEVSYNYFAQTTAGTVCYFGEQVYNYENGIVVNNDGTWTADYNTAFPGIYMPANPQRGMTFKQEDAPGTAEDEGTIANAGKVKVPAGTFTNTIKVQEFNPLDRSRGSKIYAAGVGLIKDGSLSLYP